MWLSHSIILILSCSCSRSIGTFECKKPPVSECQNTPKINHLESVMNDNIENIKQLLNLYRDTNRQIVDISQELERQFEHQHSVLDQLIERHNSSLVIMPTNPTQSCSVSAATNQSTIAVEPVDSCSDLSNTDQALLQPPDQSPPFWVLCVQQHIGTGSGWLVIQERVSGKENFFRNWMDYRKGFGSLESEFWMGLKNIYRLIAQQNYELLVEMTDFEGNYKFARYSCFEIADEDDEYALRSICSYSGTAGDSLRAHVGLKFSTYDNDNDHIEGRNCAMAYSSGWWFDKCFANGANLNGLHVKSETFFSINWYGYSNKWQSLKYTRMMMRPIQ